MPIIKPKSMEEFDAEREKLANTYYVVDFYADWCPPCRRLGDYFHDKVNPNVHVFKLDVEIPDFSEYFNSFNMDGIPYVIFFNKGAQIKETVEGFDTKKVDNILAKLASS